MEPNNPELLARAGLLRNDEGDNSPEVDALLRRAVTLNPRDSRTLIVLGLREEFRGDKTAAEKDLRQAVDVDHQYTPAWSLASFYFRTGQHEKFWPVVAQVLELNPLLVDLNPLFDLCWHETDDSQKILSVLPRRPDIIFPYLSFLVNSQRTEAAVAAAPIAAGLVDPKNTPERNTLIGFVNLLLREDQGAKAAAVWNQLVDRGVLKYGKVLPQNGAALADPTFAFAPLPSGFGWHTEPAPGIAPLIDHFARFELDGDEPERSLLLWALAVVEPGHTGKFSWTIDTAQLSEPADPGLAVEVHRSDKPDEKPLARCRLTMQPTSCSFEAPPGIDEVLVQVVYQRAPGTVRIKGVFRISELRLAFSD